jgi:hypothetical protein
MSHWKTEYLSKIKGGQINNLLTAMDVDSVSMEAQAAIDKLRKDSISEPLKHRIMDHHSSPWNSGWCLRRTISHTEYHQGTHLNRTASLRENKTMRNHLHQ